MEEVIINYDDIKCTLHTIFTILNIFAALLAYYDIGSILLGIFIGVIVLLLIQMSLLYKVGNKEQRKDFYFLRIIFSILAMLGLGALKLYY